MFADMVVGVFMMLLVAATLTASGALAPILWTAISQSIAGERVANPHPCRTIKNEQDRLDCFDKYVDGI